MFASLFAYGMEEIEDLLSLPQIAIAVMRKCLGLRKKKIDSVFS